MKISAVINTLNEENNIVGAIKSVSKFCDEVVVVDMRSTDKTTYLAKKHGARVFKHKRMGYVEPARNYAIGKTKSEWVFVLDADERVGNTLSMKLKKHAAGGKTDFVEIPRKNIIFGQWIKNSRWWPDYNIRFFRKGSVKWSNKIHEPPQTQGLGEKLAPKEKYAIIHHHYDSIEQYIGRMNRYTSIQVQTLQSQGYKFIWTDLISKPTGEFLSRYFDGEGYRDGLHGLSLALLQAFSQLVLYLKVWQQEKYETQQLSVGEVAREVRSGLSQFNWWVEEIKTRNLPFFIKYPSKLIRKFTSR